MSGAASGPPSAGYGWQAGGTPHSCSYIVPKVIEVLTRLKPQRVLDIGAGSGALCAEMTRYFPQVVGLEPDAQGAELARRVAPAARILQLGVEADGASLRQTEGTFDAVVSTEVIEHLYAPHLLPALAAQVLLPGGYLVLTTPYHGYLKNLALSIAGKWDHHHTALWCGGHIKFWSRATLTHLLDQQGFDVVEFLGVGRAPYLWKSMVMVARKRDMAAT